MTDSEELGAVSAELEDSVARASDELLTIGSSALLSGKSVELEDVFPASELESMAPEDDETSKASLRELEYVAPSSLLAGAGSHCSGMSTLEDESEEHAVSAATAAPVKNTPSLVFVNRMF